MEQFAAFQFSSHCPRCRTKRAGFSVLMKERFSEVSSCFYETLAVCGVCNKAVVACFRDPHGRAQLQTANLHECRLAYLLPKPPESGAPRHTPDNIGSFFKQGVSSLNAGNHDAAGAMFRKTLDTCLKDKFPDIEGRLEKRIKRAAEDHKLTPALADWAHHIRLEGNEASHGGEPYKEEQAREVKTFTELVLMYLYMLPGMLEEARERGAEN